MVYIEQLSDEIYLVKICQHNDYECDEYNYSLIDNVTNNIVKLTGVFYLYGSYTKVNVVEGIIHNENGPAINYGDGTHIWALNGKSYDFDEWVEKLDVSDNEKLLMVLKYG